ncbi:undecaprenyl-phosphate glucose phosphotransferase [Paraflavitalea sp. CAU 1676]|uniref:undecaprenyl-phosphate glucose phosphotransferase n=1 Tax=Paraflavitalea sp. CAU 1676 TaxID=3032598 RepID=UPI0023DAB420|nr:undecaprenyl-phosphate glucose phosphotransferase [Paraflavitalea sp. CAU 1676]MDF2188462.1 undecaprenyl-phosphate glucose phosphotransferase [Paraflavitalea sp. CAU 1676]
MNTYFRKLIRACVVFLDLLSLNASLVLSELLFRTISATATTAYVYFWVWMNISWLLVTWICSVYHEKHIFSFESLSRLTMRAYFYWLVLVLVYLFFARQFELSRLYIAGALIIFGVLLLLNRFLLLILWSYFKHHPFMERKVMIIGYNNMAKKLASYLEEGMNTEIVGFCEEAENVNELSNYPILDSVSNSIVASRQHQVTEIYSTIAPEHNAGIYRLMQDADQACIHFRIIPDLSYFVKRTVHINYLKDIPVLSLRQEPLSDEGNRLRKRCFDIVISLLVTIFLLSWMVPLLGMLICLESGGPIFFKQPRTGRNKKSFNCLKFRSMRENKDAHLKSATVDDNRFTRIGRFMRRHNLDEFPQFINVLKGDMSVVGPRPHMLKHTDDFSRLIDKYMVRQFLKPGITGWAQVHGYRGEIRTVEQIRERVDYDIWYMENWGLWLDVRIMFMTVLHMFTGDKNAF